MESNQAILRKASIINAIKSIKENIADVALTSDDLASIKEAEKDFRTGRTKRL